jgi:hypothetical protein
VSGDGLSKKERIAAEIAECRNAAGVIEVDRVIEAARNPASVMHDEFPWDVNVAAQIAWRARARELIRECRTIITYADRQLAVPVYVSNPQTTVGGYIRTVSVARNAAMKRLALEAEVGRIRSAIQRALSLAIAFDLAPQFEAMLQRVVEIEIELGTRVDEVEGVA